MVGPGSVSPLTPAYSGRRVALLTQHGKEAVLRPLLEPALGCTIERVGGFDTDLLGSFTRETPRPGSQMDALRRKVRKGMELSGLPLGLASEGSFGPDPFGGLFPWNVELVIWIDDEQGVEVVGMAQGPAHNSHLLTADWAELEAFAVREDFPRHLLVLRPEHPDDPRVHKGLSDMVRRSRPSRPAPPRRPVGRCGPKPICAPVPIRPAWNASVRPQPIFCSACSACRAPALPVQRPASG